MFRFASTLLVAFACLFALTACKQDNDLEGLKVPRLLIESRGVNYGALTGDVVTLPVSGTSISVLKEPVVNEFDIYNVELVKVDMGMALLLQLSEKGARDLYRASVSNMGGRIVLTINGVAIGARRIDGAIQNGNLYTFVEVADEELGQLVLDLKESLGKIQKLK